MSELRSLAQIFQQRLLRIPDYQRGYAWQEPQWNDFWEDLVQLAEDRIHYTGVITLEPVEPKLYQRWESDQWLIEGVGFRPFYVVDGQQRLTTAVILVQCILESVPAETQLNYKKRDDIREQYILQKAADDLQKSFVFGYEKDNPSDEYLRTKIFGADSASNHDDITLYTRNLQGAKNYFLAKLAGLKKKKIELLFRKLTQKLKFNVYEIDSEVDVFVTFETMNNRGKVLSSLELLKNRLIYLSTLFPENAGHVALRKQINDSWKTIYEYLGRNPDKPLADGLFLRNHWTMYFKYTRRKGDDYIKFLLNEKFTAKNVTHPTRKKERVTIEDIEAYVRSLRTAAKPWFYMHNPYFHVAGYDDERNRLLLDRLDRLSFRAFKPLILAAFCSKRPIAEINKLLDAAERYNFTLFSLSQRRSNTGDTEFFSLSRDVLMEEVSVKKVIEKIDALVERYYSAEKFADHIEERYEVGREGFYHWDGLRYFLYEYEADLNARSRHPAEKMNWASLNKHKKGSVTVEHIYPQTAADEWQATFERFDDEQRKRITHSLGNLLPLAQAKNAALQNYAFPRKVDNGNGVGYANGSFSEIEVSRSENWDADAILQRGLRMLSFMERRWRIVLGEDAFKQRLLCLEFLGGDDNEETAGL